MHNQIFIKWSLIISTENCVIFLLEKNMYNYKKEIIKIIKCIKFWKSSKYLVNILIAPGSLTFDLNSKQSFFFRSCMIIYAVMQKCLPVCRESLFNLLPFLIWFWWHLITLKTKICGSINPLPLKLTRHSAKTGESWRIQQEGKPFFNSFIYYLLLIHLLFSY